MRVTVIGTGYVGLTTGVALAHLGHDVVGVDRDIQKIEMLRGLKSPIHEHGLEEMMRQAGRRLRFTTETIAAVADADIIMIAVGTPSLQNGAADTRFVEAAAKEVAEGLCEGRRYTIVVKSTVPVGTNRRVAHVIARCLSDRGVKADLLFASNPEFLREGKALQDTLYPDRLVIGSDQSEAIGQLRQLYQPLLDQSFSAPSFLPRPGHYHFPSWLVTSATSAEMIKYAANAFLALKISYINEIAGLCSRIGADVTQVAHGMGLDHRISPHFLNAGLGWGGSCFPKDTAALMVLGEEYGYPMPLVTASRVVNDRQRLAVVEELQRGLKVIRGHVVAVLGIAFKPGTDDIRDAPAVDIILALVEHGAHVRIHDPVALKNAEAFFDHPDIECVASIDEVSRDVDAVVLATEWPEYGALDLNVLAGNMRGKLLVDGRNLFNRARAEEAGLTYVGIGR